MTKKVTRTPEDRARAAARMARIRSGAGGPHAQSARGNRTRRDRRRTAIQFERAAHQ